MKHFPFARIQSSVLFVLFALTCCSLPGFAAPAWFPLGPNGGDARAFARDPQDHLHVYLGTANGWIYESRTGGQSWQRLARLENRDDLVLDSIVVDAKNPKHLFVGAWVIDRADGGLYTSNDGGKSWSGQAQMQGQSIRALTAAPSDPQVLVAGTLQGIYRSGDGGSTWNLISPPENKEIHEVESIAIDPADPKIIYAGTWHLPWRTVDGGVTWSSMKQGLIDDSDVFSIIVDPAQPRVVYVSACSGIYKSDTGGEQFKKIAGIPSTARRTRVLMQDPNHEDVVFAGTTEGLYRTVDAGKTFARMSEPNVIVNDVSVDPANSHHVLLATDRGGVLVSEDGGSTFAASNDGYSARQVIAYARSKNQPASLYVGVVNDKEFGGVFRSGDGGLSWKQASAGLDGRDVFSLGETSTGVMVAGTSHGIYRLMDERWSRTEELEPLAPVVTAATPVRRKGSATAKAGVRKISARQVKVLPPVVLDGAVFGLAAAGSSTFAATADGLLVSSDEGQHWLPAQGMAKGEWRFVSSAKDWVVAGTPEALMRSGDAGSTWQAVALPPSLNRVATLTVDDAGEVWVGGREGVFFSADGGTSWKTPKNLYLSSVHSMVFDSSTQRLAITAGGMPKLVFSVQLPAKTVSYVDTGWALRFALPSGDHMVAATLFDGIVVQPKMVVSPEVAQHGGTR